MIKFSFMSISLFFMFFFLNFIYIFLSKFYFFEFSFFILNFMMYIDHMTILFTMFVTLITSMIFYFNNYYMKNDNMKYNFSWILFLFMLSMLLLILFPSLPLILLGWDYLGLVSYLLIIFYQTKVSSSSGMITIMSNRIGDVFILFSIMFMLSNMNNSSLMFILSMLLFMAILTKSAQVPFSVWLPAAMMAPTPVSALVHSSTLVTAGIYMLIRFNNILTMNSLVMMVLLTLGLLTSFLASMKGMFEMDGKKVIALSTLSQLGFMMLSALMLNIYLCFFHLLTHALFKSLLFMTMGYFIHTQEGNQDIRGFQNMKMSSFQYFIFSMSLISMIGFPFLAGFFSKDLIIEMCTNRYNILFMELLLILSISFTMSYSMRLFFIFSKNSIFYSFISTAYNDSKVFISFFFIFIMMISLSSFLSFFFIFSLDWSYKILPNLFLTLGIALFFLFFSYSFMADYKMFGLLMLSSQQISKSILKLSNILEKSNEMGWNEKIGGQGMFETLSKLSMLEYYSFSFKLFIMTFFLLMVFLITLL